MGVVVYKINRSMFKGTRNIAMDFAEWVMETVIVKDDSGYLIRKPDGEVVSCDIEELYNIYLEELGSPI